MGFAHVKVELQRDGGASEDVVVNTFNFGDPDRTALQMADDISTTIDNFYNNVPGVGLLPVGAWISELISRGPAQHVVSIYDISVAHIPIEHERPDGSTYFGPGPMGSPVRQYALTLPNPDPGSPLPAEVAACLSYSAGLVLGEGEEIPDPANPGETIRPRARKRGRVYIGPLIDNAVVREGGETMLTPAIRGSLTEALQTVLIDNANLDFVLWSRVTGFMHDVVWGWVDNAPDVIRRRGGRATARTVVGTP